MWRISSICSSSRSADRPLATVRRGEWSVRASHWCPSALRGLCHLGGRTASVRPRCVRVTVPAQRLAHRADRRMLSGTQQLGEVHRVLARQDLSNDLGCGRAYPSKGLQIAGLHKTGKLAIGKGANNLGSTPESADAVGSGSRARSS